MNCNPLLYFFEITQITVTCYLVTTLPNRKDWVHKDSQILVIHAKSRGQCKYSSPLGIEFDSFKFSSVSLLISFLIIVQIQLFEQIGPG